MSADKFDPSRIFCVALNAFGMRMPDQLSRVDSKGELFTDAERTSLVALGATLMDGRKVDSISFRCVNKVTGENRIPGVDPLEVVLVVSKNYVSVLGGMVVAKEIHEKVISEVQKITGGFIANSMEWDVKSPAVINIKFDFSQKAPAKKKVPAPSIYKTGLLSGLNHEMRENGIKARYFEVELTVGELFGKEIGLLINHGIRNMQDLVNALNEKSHGSRTTSYFLGYGYNREENKGDFYTIVDNKARVVFFYRTWHPEIPPTQVWEKPVLLDKQKQHYGVVVNNLSATLCRYGFRAVNSTQGYFIDPVDKDRQYQFPLGNKTAGDTGEVMSKCASDNFHAFYDEQIKQDINRYASVDLANRQLVPQGFYTTDRKGKIVTTYIPGMDEQFSEWFLLETQPQVSE